MSLLIAGVGIGEAYPCRLVAEISNNHNGSLERALRLIVEAKRAGADFVKFQCYTAEELVALRGDGPAPPPWGSQGWNMRSLYERAQTPLEWFPRLFEVARLEGVVPFASVFGDRSLQTLQAVDCPAYKIAALDNYQPGLLRLASSPGRPVLVSTNGRPIAGYSDMRLWCPPGYPAIPQDVRLPARFWSADYYGLSSHCLAPELPVAAVARGAKLIEMHFMLQDEPSELEAPVSLTEYQFRAMVQSVRQTEALCR